MTFPGKLVNEQLPDTAELPTSISPAPSSETLVDDSHNSSTIKMLKPASLQTSTPRTTESAFAGYTLNTTTYPISHIPTSPARPASLTYVDPIDQTLLDEVIFGKSKPRCVFDPRDHSLLEHIYTEMHAARFINLEPLALLKNSLSVIFGGKW